MRCSVVSVLSVANGGLSSAAELEPTKFEAEPFKGPKAIGEKVRHKQKQEEAVHVAATEGDHASRWSHCLSQALAERHL